MLGGLNNDFVLWMSLLAVGFSFISLIVWGFRMVMRMSSSSGESESN